MTVRTQGEDGFRQALGYILDLLERGLVVSISAHLDPTGIGRISFTTHSAAVLDLGDLPGVASSDDLRDTIPDE